MVANADEALDFLRSLGEIDVTPDMEEDIREYAANSVMFPKRYKVRQRVYFIVIKTTAATMQDFKDKKALRPMAVQQNERKEIQQVYANKLTEERNGWYEGVLDFKRVVLVPATGKYEYRDTHFVVRCKAKSGIDCYNRMVEHLKERVDSRSQFPSAKGKNFQFRYLGMWK